MMKIPRVQVVPFRRAGRQDRARWSMLALLTFFVVVSYIDRTVLSLLIVPIKADLQLTDTQASLLLGLAFALFYGVVSIPAGYLVDRYSRKHVLFAAILLWTAMTFLSGLAGSFVVLLLCRTGVGLGEAFLAPGAYSMINDSFEGGERSRAFSVFSLGNAIGGGVALAIVGGLLGWLGQGILAGPLAGTHAWQIVLLLLGAAGVPLSFLMLACREPERHGRTATDSSFAAAATHIRSDPATYALLFGANLLVGIGMFGSAAWIPTMIQRTWALPLPVIGQTYGVIQIAASLIGLLGSGMIFDRWCRAGREVAIALCGGMAIAIAGIALAAAPHMASLPACWAAFALMLLMLPCAPVVSAVILTRLTPARMVGKFSALAFLIVSAAGTAIGPTLIAFISDSLSGGGAAIGWGLSLGGGAVLVLSGLLWLALAFRLRGPHAASISQRIP